MFFGCLGLMADRYVVQVLIIVMLLRSCVYVYISRKLDLMLIGSIIVIYIYICLITCTQSSHYCHIVTYE